MLHEQPLCSKHLTYAEERLLTPFHREHEPSARIRRVRGHPHHVGWVHARVLVDLDGYSPGSWQVPVVCKLLSYFGLATIFLGRRFCCKYKLVHSEVLVT